MAHNPEKLVQTALDSECPAHQLRLVAMRLKDDGNSQRMIYELFDSFRDRLSDPELPGYDDVLDTMDLIVGWSSPANAIFDGPIPDDVSPT